MVADVCKVDDGAGAGQCPQAIGEPRADVLVAEIRGRHGKLAGLHEGTAGTGARPRADLCCTPPLVTQLIERVGLLQS